MTNGEKGMVSYLSYSALAFTELLVLILANEIYTFLKVNISAFGAPQLTIDTLSIVKPIVLATETLYILISFVMTFFLVCYKAEETFKEIWSFFGKFCFEIFVSFVLLFIGLLVAVSIGNMQPVDIETTILFYGLYIFFFLFMIGYFVLLVVSMYNSFRSRSALVLLAKAKRREEQDAD